MWWMPARKLNLHLALANNGSLVFVLDVTHNLDRKETGRIIDRVTYRKSRVLQPVENLIGIHIIATRNLRDRHARKPRLRANHTLLVIAPVPAQPPLRHPINPVVSINPSGHYPSLPFSGRAVRPDAYPRDTVVAVTDEGLACVAGPRNYFFNMG